MDKVATNKRQAAALFIESGLSLQQANAFFADENIAKKPYVLMDDVQDFIRSCGGIMGVKVEIHESFRD